MRFPPRFCRRPHNCQRIRRSWHTPSAHRVQPAPLCSPHPRRPRCLSGTCSLSLTNSPLLVLLTFLPLFLPFIPTSPSVSSSPASLSNYVYCASVDRLSLSHMNTLSLTCIHPFILLPSTRPPPVCPFSTTHSLPLVPFLSLSLLLLYP